jgi:hypothetical protein
VGHQDRPHAGWCVAHRTQAEQADRTGRQPERDEARNYAVYVRAYNGSGPAADAYAARVLADAHAYQGVQRPFLERWPAARLGGHANVRILMPGDLALLLGAPALVASGRPALPPLADRVLLAQVARSHTGYFEPVAEAPGFAEALYRLVRELKAAGYDLSGLGGLLDGATDAPAKAASLAEILAAFEARRGAFYGPDDALMAAEGDRLTGLGLLAWGMLDLAPVLERLLAAISAHMPVEVFVPKLASSADAPIARARRRLIASGAVTVELAVGETADFCFAGDEPLQQIRHGSDNLWR